MKITITRSVIVRLRTETIQLQLQLLTNNESLAMTRKNIYAILNFPLRKLYIFLLGFIAYGFSIGGIFYIYILVKIHS